MAPRKRLVSELGGVTSHENGWRAEMQISGKNVRAPLRHVMAAAEDDFRAMRAAPSREAAAGVAAGLRAAVATAREGDTSPPEAGQPVEGTRKRSRPSGASGKRCDKARPAATRETVATRMAEHGRQTQSERVPAELAAIFTIKRQYAEAVFRCRKTWEGRPDGASGTRHVHIASCVAFRFGGLCRRYPRIVAKVTEIRRYRCAREMLIDLGIPALLPDCADDLDAAVAVYHGLGSAFEGGMVAFHIEGAVWEEHPPSDRVQAVRHWEAMRPRLAFDAVAISEQS